MTIGDHFAMGSGVIIPFVAIIAAIVLLWGRGINALDLWMLIIGYALTVLGITVGYHRLFTHRSFETSAPVRFLLAVFGSMALQGPVIQWVAIHRRHHQESDRDGDPHSPHVFGGGMVGMLKGMWHSHIGWLFHPDPVDINRSVRDLLADPAVRAADRYFWWFVLLGLAIPAAIGGIASHSWIGAATGLLWGGLVRMFLMHHATFSINSVCHIWGTRPFKNTDHSRNNPIFGLVSFGEGWHNNHHAFPTSARHGLRWWQVDISWYFIRTLALLGLAKNIRRPSAAAMTAKLRSDTIRLSPKAEPSHEINTQAVS
jgi:stearoyl-CoA desaturase (delta-9 desaturase)